MGDIPASYVSLPAGIICYIPRDLFCFDFEARSHGSLEFDDFLFQFFFCDFQVVSPLVSGGFIVTYG